MSMKVLITGGAGFIGGHLAEHLLDAGHQVRVLDSQVPRLSERHSSSSPPSRPEIVGGELSHPDTLRKALRDIDAVIHLAPRQKLTREGHSILSPISHDHWGTAQLLSGLIEKPVQRLIVASGMSIYGEGLYQDAKGTVVCGQVRPLEQVQAGSWELWLDGRILLPIPTPESKPPAFGSAHAVMVYAQEQLSLILGREYNIPTVVLRLTNVYGAPAGPLESSSGVISDFASRLLNDRAPVIYEDGYQQRDFIHIQDVVRAFGLALESSRVVGTPLNIGSGHPVTIREVARRLANVLGKEHLEWRVTEQFRTGDIRHCFPDIHRARELLEFEPGVTLENGLAEMGEWFARNHRRTV